MVRDVWDRLLHEAQLAHATSAEAQEFAPFPQDLVPQTVEPFHAPCGDFMARETGLFTDRYADLRDAFLAAAPYAKWRETYKGTDIGQDFMDRFGCYNLIGMGGAFMSKSMWVWVVYMPPHLYYPRHHHPGEELYLVLAGEALFLADGVPDKVMRAGGTSLHASNQPHAMETKDHPVMALVMWRNGFGTPPVLT